MRVILCLVSLSAVHSFAGPEVSIECPAGTHFVKNKGCQATIATAAPSCPGGTKFDGKKCIALVDTSCPAGMKFVAGTGCVARNQVVAMAAPGPAPAPAPAPENVRKGGTFAGGFLGDRLRSNCNGIEFDVLGGSRLTGVRAMLMANGTRVGSEEDVNVGQTRHITGSVGDKAVDLRVTQALFGTRYVLKVDGAECRLGK